MSMASAGGHGSADALRGVRVAVLTLSDTVFAGQGKDRSGDEVEAELLARGADLVRRDVLGDDLEAISRLLIEYADNERLSLVLTTGGSGISPRDVTPEATSAVVDRLVPGLVEAARISTLSRTPLAMLSRAVAGVRGRTLIVNLPGSPAAVREWLEVLMPALPHAVRMVRGDAGQWGTDHRKEVAGG